MKKRIFAIVVFITLTIVAYLGGRSSVGAELVQPHRPPPSFFAVPQSFPPLDFRLEETFRVAFVDLYRSLQSTSHQHRGDLVRELRSISNRRKRNAAIASFFKCLVMIDVDEAIGFLPKLERDDDKIQAVEAVIRGSASPATPTMVKMLMTLPGEVGERCREKYLLAQISFWSALDPVAAAQFVDDHPSEVADVSETALIANWGAIDPAGAEAWLGRHPELSSNPLTLIGFVQGVYQNNPEIAREYVIINANDERFEGIISTVANHSFLSSPEAAEKFIVSLPNADARSRAIQGIAGSDMKLLAGAEREGPREFKSVADWILKFPEEDRAGSLTTLLSNWQQDEPPHSLEWVGKVPPEKQEQVIEEYAATLKPGSIRRTLAPCDAQLRSRILTAFVVKLGATPAERAELVNQLGLASEEMEVVARIVRKHQIR